MEITDLAPMPLVMADGHCVSVPVQRWTLERWLGGADPVELPPIWARKPGFAVRGRRSCAELAVLDHLRREGWDGVWVSAFGAQELRREWFPAPSFRTAAEAGAPGWAAAVFGRLRAANSGNLGGFFDVFAWREPGRVRFDEVKVGSDRIRGTQLRFVQTAESLGLLGSLTIIEVAAHRDSGRRGRQRGGEQRAAEFRVPGVTRFQDDDSGFLAWMQDNPGGYIVNSRRNPRPSYLVLHRPGCRHLKSPNALRWTADYVKFCSTDRAPLDDWALTRVGGPVTPCRTCFG